jgi:hypothetical protein
MPIANPGACHNETQSAASVRGASHPIVRAARHGGSATPPLDRRAVLDGECYDDNFLHLTEALRPFGGILPLEVLRALCHVGNPGFGLAESIMRGDVFTLNWRRETWVPCFQFRGVHWTPCHLVSRITAECRPAIDRKNLALWFIEPSPWLQGATPLSLVHSDTERVRQAARVARFAVSH